MKFWRHKARGTVYEMVGTAILQCKAGGYQLTDDAVMVVYRGSDGQLWVRPATEFHDGRFERITGE